MDGRISNTPAVTRATPISRLAVKGSLDRVLM
jgi:hypothetical protein